jgi:hypothetical protein
MTFCELVGVIEICVLPLCAIPTTGIVARDRRAAQVENNFLMVALSRTFQGYPAKASGHFPNPANSLPNPAWNLNFVHTSAFLAVR